MPFILDGLDTEDYDRNYTDRELLRRISQYFAPHSRQMIVVGAALALNSLAGTASPILISRAIDLIAVRPDIKYVLLLSFGVVLMGVVAWVFNFIRQWVSAKVIGDVVLNLRQDVFDATIRHDLSFYDEHPSGKIVSRVTSDTQDFSNVVTLVVDVIAQLLLVVILFIWLLTISWRLALLVIATAPFVFIIALSFRHIARKVTRNARRVTAKINAQIQESISGIVVAKAFRQEKAIYETFEKNNRQAYRVGLVKGITLFMIFPAMNLFSGVALGIVAFVGGLATRDGAISPGNWYLFMQSVWYFLWPMMSLASFWSQFQDGLSASERVFALIDAEPKVIQTGAEKSKSISGAIRFVKVGFSYNENETVLKSFSLSIDAGENVALVGHTGAGKSSIARLVARFYEFQTGGIFVDNRDIRDLDLGSYRRHIGFVPQSPFLFTGSVVDNIRYGSDGATDAMAAEAALHIAGGEWLEELPNGLETDVGTRGSSLSMGQRQLVALTRVLLKNPEIFILDEATASVDPFTERQIQMGLEELMRNRTAIVIAHRLSTVQNADRIIVLSAGEIIEEGTHDELLAGGGHYADLYNAYFRHQSLSYIEEFGRS